MTLTILALLVAGGMVVFVVLCAVEGFGRRRNL
jgi:hypothetical protein